MAQRANEAKYNQSINPTGSRRALETGSRGDVNRFLELDHLALPLLLASKLEVLSSLDGDLKKMDMVKINTSKIEKQAEITNRWSEKVYQQKATRRMLQVTKN